MSRFFERRIYLRATSIVSMPLFNWSNDPGDSVLNSHFWVYWAVTVPLTVAVLSTWWLWKEWRHRTDKANDDAVLVKESRERKTRYGDD